MASYVTVFRRWSFNPRFNIPTILAATWENVPSDMYAQRWLKPVCKLAQNDPSTFPHKETLHPWLLIIRLVKILISLREYAGWSESSQGQHVWRYVFWRHGSFYFLSADISVLSRRTEIYSRSFFPSSVDYWNKLPLSVRNADSLSDFKQLLKRSIFRSPKLFCFRPTHKFCLPL